MSRDFVSFWYQANKKKPHRACPTTPIPIPSNGTELRKSARLFRALVSIVFPSPVAEICGRFHLRNDDRRLLSHCCYLWSDEKGETDLVSSFRKHRRRRNHDVSLAFCVSERNKTEYKISTAGHFNLRKTYLCDYKGVTLIPSPWLLENVCRISAQGLSQPLTRNTRHVHSYFVESVCVLCGTRKTFFTPPPHYALSIRLHF